MISRQSMGYTTDGQEVFRYRLENEDGTHAEIATLGGCLLSVCVPDRAGVVSDVLLGYDRVETMQAAEGYMGMLIGRYANRIGGASFMLHGESFSLHKNDGSNHLHGGLKGFDKKIWAARVDKDRLVLSIKSPDGEEGYPGNLDVEIAYLFTSAHVLRIEYRATCDQDTVINLTNHAYFNLSGPQSSSIGAHKIQIHADVLTAVRDAGCIPTGEMYALEGTPMDLRTPRPIGEGLAMQEQDMQMRYGGGYDHNYVIRGWDGTLRQACVLSDPDSGRRMETWTDQPGVQFYSGNQISGDVPGKLGKPYISRQGLCLETQHFPDSVHHENFPSCVLRKGETYRTATEYRFSVEG